MSEQLKYEIKKPEEITEEQWEEIFQKCYEFSEGGAEYEGDYISFEGWRGGGKSAPQVIQEVLEGIEFIGNIELTAYWIEQPPREDFVLTLKGKEV